MPSFEADCSVSSRNLKSDRGFSYIMPHHSMMLTQQAPLLYSYILIMQSSSHPTPSEFAENKFGFTG